MDGAALTLQGLATKEHAQQLEGLGSAGHVLSRLEQSRDAQITHSVLAAQCALTLTVAR